MIIRIRPPESWAVDVARKTQTPIMIHSLIQREGGEVEGIIEVEADEETSKKVLFEINSHQDILRTNLEVQKDGRLTGSVTVRRWYAFTKIIRSHGFIKGARAKRDGTIEWHILIGKEESLRSLVQGMVETGCEVRLLRKSRVEDSKVLSKNQERVLMTAYELGYFDYPRRISAKELAKRLGIVQSTLYESLQSSQKKLVEMYLLKNR